MKNILSISINSSIRLVCCLLLFLFYSCKSSEYKHGPLVLDDIPPKPITVATAKGTPGGLDIDYKLPKEEDLLYVKAQYTDSHKKTSEMRVSAYVNKISIKGFADTSEKEVKLYAIDKSGNTSKAYVVKGKPLEATINAIKKSMSIYSDIGSIMYKWKNPQKERVEIYIIGQKKIVNQETEKIKVYDELDDINILSSSDSNGVYKLTGYDDKPYRFVAVIQDAYGNRTDTIFPKGNRDIRLTVKEEKQIDPINISKVVLPGDLNFDNHRDNLYSKFRNLLDGDIKTPAFTNFGSPVPRLFTVDLSKITKVTHFKMLQTTALDNDSDSYAYFGWPKRVEIYGIKKLPDYSRVEYVGIDRMLNDGWKKIADFKVIKPSGGSGEGLFSKEDRVARKEGDNVPLYKDINDVPEVRYLRIVFPDFNSYGNITLLMFGEWQFFRLK